MASLAHLRTEPSLHNRMASLPHLHLPIEPCLVVINIINITYTKYDSNKFDTSFWPHVTPSWQPIHVLPDSGVARAAGGCRGSRF